jgi:translation initiation factor IF-3
MIHEVRMRPRIGRADMERKVSLVERLLGEGDKVKLAVMFRGREMSHPEIGREVLDRALEGLNEAAVVEKPPSMEGRFLTVILTPGLKKAAPRAKAEGGEAAEEAAVPAGGAPRAEPEAAEAETPATE